MKQTLYHIESVISTNTWLSDYLNADFSDRNRSGVPFLADGDAVVTYRQTDGRGQQGNHWESAMDENICMSLLLRPENIPATDSFVISEAVSLGVCSLLENIIPQPVTIKWPNDIYVGDRKICGILIENRFEGQRIASSIVGVGLNVNQKLFVSDAPNPVSICQLSGSSSDLNELSVRLHDSILAWYGKVEPEMDCCAVRQAYWNHLYRRDGWYPFEDKTHGVFNAGIYDIDNQGFLTLQVQGSNELRRYAFKEVRYLFI